MSLEQCLEQIADDSASLNIQGLIEVSDLTPAELGRFARTWYKVSTERKYKVMERLVVIAQGEADEKESTSGPEPTPEESPEASLESSETAEPEESAAGESEATEEGAEPNAN